MDISTLRYLVVEGPIGVGKTSLARRLATHVDGELLLEAPEENPFMAKFYEDIARYAFPTQINFLFQRVDQLRALTQLDLFQRPTISDFLFDKDPLFARMNLSEDEYHLYDKIFRQLQPQTPTPDLVIYLQAPTDTLIERVRRRGNNYERPITDDYLARLADEYSRYFYSYTAAPLLTVNTTHLNFVDEPEHFRLLLQRIAGMRSNREFFSLAAE